MKFENPKVPEGINVSRHSPLYEFFLLGLGTVLLFAAIGFSLLFVGSIAGRHAPVAWENAVAGVILGDLKKETPAEHQAVEAELQALAERLAEHIELPEGLTLTLHYADDDIVNAFATVGGHIFIARGLIERMPSENALAMVVAHEVAHIAHRDPAAGLGGGLLLQIFLTLATTSGSEVPGEVIFGPNALLLNSFSREAEREADAAALAAVAAHYGHVAGATAFFDEMLGLPQPPELMSTHPLTQDRIDAITQTAGRKSWPRQGEATPLSPALEKLRSPE